MDNTTKNADLQPDGTPFGRLRLRLEDGTTLSDEIVSFTLTAGCSADTTGPSLGSTAAATITVKLAGTDRKLENQFLLPEVRYTQDGQEHWMPLGRFRCETPETGEDTVTVTAVDAMLWALEAGYFPEGAPSTAFAVLEDICTQAGLTLGSLDGLTDVPVSGVGSGYTLREMAGYMAALLGRNAVIGRAEQLELRWFSSSGVTVTPDDYYSGGFTRKDYDYTISSIQVSIGDGEEDTLSTGSGTGLSLANPYMTETTLEQVWTAVGGLAYRPGEVTILGNLSLEPGDLVTVTDLSGSSYLFPIMEVTHSYDGGWKTKLSAYGNAETDTSSSYKGPATTALERYTADMASFKQLYAQNLTAVNATIGHLQTDKLDAAALTAYRAEVENLLVDKADVSLLNVETANIEQLLVRGGILTSTLNGVEISATRYLTGVTIVGDVIQANTLSAEKLILKGADGLIYELNAQAGNLTASQLTDEQYQAQLDGSVLAAHSVTADRINVTDLFAQDITATGTITGAKLIGGTIQGATLEAADSITAGSNFRVDSSGQLRARDAILEGSIWLWDEINSQSLMVFRAAAGAECCANIFFSNGIHVQRGAEFNDTLSVAGSADINSITCTSLAASGAVSTYGYAIPRIQKGTASVSVSASNTATSFSVTFPSTFPGTPVVTITPAHGATAAHYAKIASKSTTGFSGYVYCTNTTSTHTVVMNWIAMY